MTKYESDYITSTIWLVSEELESGRVEIEVLSWNLCESTDETTNTLKQDNQCPGQDWNRAHPKYKPTALPLHPPGRSRR
jgi:hypothetical protein